MEGYKSSKLFYSSGWFYEITKGIILAIAIIIVFSAILATVFVVDGISMEPNLHTGQYVLVEKFTYLNNAPERGDIIVLRFPGDPDKKKYIKRIIGLPNELLEIKNDKVFINSKELSEFYIPLTTITSPDTKIIIPPDEYIVMGDNREYSNDSRAWGTCPKKNIIGKAWVIILPKKDFSVMPIVEYN